MEKITFETFKKRAIEVHGDKYSYNKDNYYSWCGHVSIGCKEHGDFKQIARHHIERRWDCPHCGQLKQSKNRALDKQEFINRGKLKFSSFDYTQIENYEGITKPIILVCKKHGKFKLNKAQHHLQFDSGGCKKCSVEENKNFRLTNFIKASRKKFLTKFSYELVEYKDCNTSIQLICEQHGIIEITPKDHLRVGCFICEQKKEDIWLSEIGIPFDKGHRQVKFTINDRVRIVDGFDPNTNTIYLFHGDYWHGNPEVYESDFLNMRVGKTAGILYKETIEYENSFKQEGFNVVSIWERDWERTP